MTTYTHLIKARPSIGSAKCYEISMILLWSKTILFLLVRRCSPTPECQQVMLFSPLHLTGWERLIWLPHNLSACALCASDHHKNRATATLSHSYNGTCMLNQKQNQVQCGISQLDLIPFSHNPVCRKFLSITNLRYQNLVTLSSNHETVCCMFTAN